MVCPAAVLGAIVPVVVDTVERHPFRTRSHVLKKRVEAIPPVAHLDAAPAVTRITASRWVRASPAHCSPRSIFGRRLQPAALWAAWPHRENWMAMTAATERWSMAALTFVGEKALGAADTSIPALFLVEITQSGPMRLRHIGASPNAGQNARGTKYNGGAHNGRATPLIGRLRSWNDAPRAGFPTLTCERRP